MSYNIDEFYKKVEELKNIIRPEKAAFSSYLILSGKNMLNKPGQKITLETKNGGLEIACDASKIVAIIGMYELMKSMGLEESVSMLAAVHGLKETGAIDTIVNGGKLPSREAFAVMKEILNKSPEELEKLKEQLNE